MADKNRIYYPVTENKPYRKTDGRIVYISDEKMRESNGIEEKENEIRNECKDF